MIELSKKLLVTEKPSVAMEFAKALKITTNRKNGYLESDNWIITWCVGHLVTMSYPEKYDEKLKFWRLDTLPFMPEEWKYEVIPQVKNQFDIVKSLLQREDVEEIYNAGDSGREGEYIQRLVYMMAKPNPKAKMKRVWIDSQTEEEILRGIREAKDMNEYDSLSDSAYLRAKEDYLIGINFSRLLSIIYGRRLAKSINEDKASISVGRVMTCVLGMIVTKEREIRNFKKTKYYKIVGKFGKEDAIFNAEWKDGKLKNLFPLSFGASNDCSIRKDGAKKISEKKNWGKETKGLSSNMILLDDFSENSKLYDYRIASFLLRDSNVFEYGENSFVKNYNYIWKKLTLWLIEKFNSQKDEGPKENIHEYLKEASFPEKILVSIGATRYTEFGERNFLKKNDEAVVVLYPDSKYCEEEIIQKVKKRDFSDSEISFLVQKICEKKS